MSLNENSVSFLEKYINNFSPVSREYKGQIVWLEYIKKYINDHYIDFYGNTVGIINRNTGYKVVIEAHADEIAWYVNYISDDGFIYVNRNGGSDYSIAISKKVVIQTNTGIVNGVFGWSAIHLRDSKINTKLSCDSVFIDIGVNSKKEVLNKGISIGDIVLFEEQFAILNDKYYVGRAFDNRIGGFIIAETARLIYERKIILPFDLYIVNTVQEEIGLKGAKMISNYIKPNIAIITDVTHDTSTPMINQKIHGDIKCGKGPVLSFSPSIHHILNDKIEKISTKYKIPFQKQVCSQGTSTDTDEFAYSNNGVPSALISIPLRYMHTTVEMVHIDDINNAIELFFHVLTNLDIKNNFKYF